MGNHITELFKLMKRYTVNPRTVFEINGSKFKFARTSLFIFGPKNKIRECIVRIILSNWFQNLSVGIIITYAINLGIADYSKVEKNPRMKTYYQPKSEGSVRNSVYNTANMIFPILFGVEMVLKVIGMGFICYIRNGWNVLDFVVVVVSLLAMSPHIPSYINIICMGRVLKTLQNISALPDLQAVTKGFLKSIPELANAVLLLFFVVVVFSVMGLALFCDVPNSINYVCRLTPYPVLTNWTVGMNVSEYRCLDAPNLDLPSKEFPTKASSPWHTPQDCYWPTDDSYSRPCTFPGFPGNHICKGSESFPTWCGSNWDALGNARFKGETTLGMYGDYYFTRDKLLAWGTFNNNMNWGCTTFDNIFKAFVTMFECVTPDGWSWIMYMYRDSNNPLIVALFFVIFVFIGTHICLNLFVAILEHHYCSAKEEILFRLQNSTQIQNSSANAEYENLFNSSKTNVIVVKSFVHTLATSRWFSFFVTVMVVLNTVVLASDHYPSSALFETNLEKINFSCTFFFAFDMAVKVLGLGVHEYCHDNFNLFDSLVVVVSIVELIVSPPAFLCHSRKIGGRALSVFRLARILRILKLVNQWSPLRVLFIKMRKILPELGNYLVLLLLLVYVLSLVGMGMFANRIRFDAFGYAIPIYDPSWGDGWVSRANYDSLDWAMFNTINILFTENWNNIMYDGWRGTENGASFLYFMVVVILGQFIGMGLFLAVLLRSFVQETEKKSLATAVSKEHFRNAALRQDTKDDLESAMRILVDDDPGMAKQCEASFSVFPLSAGRTLFLLGPTNPIRRICACIVAHRCFDYFVLALIMISSICLALNDPLLNPASNFIKTLNNVDFAFNLLFCLEMAMKIAAVGFLFQARAYLRSTWHILDFTVVVFSLLAHLPVSLNHNLRSLRVLRVFRAFRPLRLIHRIPSLKQIVRTLFVVIPGVGSVIAIVFFFLFVFGCLSISLFKGDLRYCALGYITVPGVLYDPVSNIPNTYGTLLSYPKSWNAMSETEKSWFGPANPFANDSTWHFSGNCSAVWPFAPCCASWPQDPNSPPTSREICECWGSSWEVWWGYWKFDNIFDALLALYQVGTNNGWVYLMLATIDRNGVGMQPIRDNKRNKYWMQVLFVVFMLVVEFFAFNLVVGVFVENFQKQAHGEEFLFLTEQQQIFVKTQKIASRLRPFKKCRPPGNPVGDVSFRVVSCPRFDNFIIGCLLANMLVMALQHKTQPDSLTLFMTVADYFFSFVFTIEAVLKIFAMKTYYFTDWWHCFDFFIVVCTDVGLLVASISGGGTQTIPQIFRVFRIGRMLRLIHGAESLDRLFQTLLSTIIGLCNIGALLLLIVFIFAMMGNQLYAKVAFPKFPGSTEGVSPAQLNYYYNFRTFQNSLLALISFTTGEYWDGFAMALSSTTPGCVEDPPFDAGMCGFVDLYNEVPRNDCTPLNGCGNNGANILMCLYFFMVTTTFLNLFVGIIIDEFTSLKLNKEYLGETDFKSFSEHWSRYDPDATLLMNYSNLADFLTTIGPPWQMDARLTRKSIHKKTVSWNLKIYKGNNIHFYDIIQAMTVDIMQKKLHGLNTKKPDQNFADAMKKVTRRRSSAVQPEVVNGVQIGLQHNYAAVVIQAKLRNHSIEKRTKSCLLQQSCQSTSFYKIHPGTPQKEASASSKGAFEAHFENPAHGPHMPVKNCCQPQRIFTCARSFREPPVLLNMLPHPRETLISLEPQDIVTLDSLDTFEAPSEVKAIVSSEHRKRDGSTVSPFHETETITGMEQKKYKRSFSSQRNTPLKYAPKQLGTKQIHRDSSSIKKRNSF